MACGNKGALLMVIVLAILCSEHFVNSVITDVRLVGGPVSNKGTVQIRHDNGTWETTCGINLNINDVIVICRQLGFSGASRAIASTPYAQSPITPKGLTCNGDEANLSECSLFSSQSCLSAGTASCHGERYLGCFVDNANDRVFTGESLVNDPDMTISYCIQYCNGSITGDYTYIGVENGYECFCGEAGANYALLGVGSDGNCQSPCSGDSTESCGGLGYIAVFTIHVETATPSIGSTKNTETTLSSLLTNQPEPSTGMTSDLGTGNSGMTSDPDTATLTPTLQQYGNCSCLGVAVGEGMVIIFLIATIVALVVYILLNRKSQKDSKHEHNSHDMTLVNASSSKDNNTSFYHDIQDVKPPTTMPTIDPTSQRDAHYSSRIYDQKDGHPSDIKGTNMKGTEKDADPYIEII